jgi:Cu2+-exporting ATPase
MNPGSAHPTSELNGIDIERATFSVEHVTVSVSGMTCTGCEKKLYRSLDSFPAVTNIKTSLLLAQAEFDLSGTTDSVELLKSLENMTGFTCAKMNQSGQVLDITLDGNAQNISQADMPFGVTDLEILSESTIRVTYQPKLIGARDLLSEPSFPSGRLAPVADRPLIASGRAHVKDMLFKTILSAILTIPVLVMAWAPLPSHPILYGAISLALATAVQTYIAGPFYIGAIRALLFSRMIEMDLLIVISTTTAYVYSVIAYGFLAGGAPLSTGEFFETSTLLVTLIMVGRLVSAFARQKAVESISIEFLQAPTALLVHSKYDEEIDARLLQYRDMFKVTPDTSVVTDGIVVSGESEVDESMITGEAALVAKKPGSSVVAGSINYSGTLIVQLTRLPGENTISSIGNMVDEAKSSKPRIQHIADRVAGYFVPVILLITVLVFVVWVAVGKAVRHQNATNTCITAMTYAISALIVSCPCAIGLAVPMVVVIAGGVAAKNGLIFKTAETIEIARSLTHVVFDKTGTLTQGLLSIEIEEYPEGKASLPALALLSLTKDSKHPVSVAIAAHLEASGIESANSKLEGATSVPGKGVQGKWQGSVIQAGNPFWLGVENDVLVREALKLGLSIFCVSLDGKLVAVFGLKDVIRPGAIDVIQQLHERSIKVSIVSGDNEESVKSVARQLGVPEANIRYKCSPEEKSHYVRTLLSPKKVVMFCGDGTNDAVALAQANIGMHINGGTDIAQSAADAILVRPSLKGILTLVNLSRAFYSRVMFNFAWSFVYNLFAILLAAGAFPHARIPPQFAGLGEIVSVLPVIAVALQLRWAKID